MYRNYPEEVCGIVTALSGNTFSEGDVIAIGTRLPNVENHFFNDGIPYYVFDNIIIDEGKTLTCDPGVVVKLNRKGISVHGTLNAKQATFTTSRPMEDPDKNWRALYFWPESAGNLENCVVEYGGNGQIVYHINDPEDLLQAEGNIVISGTNNVLLNQVTTRNAGNSGIWLSDCSPNIQALVSTENRDGIWVRDGAMPTVIGSQFFSNTSIGAFCWNANPSFISCIFKDNEALGFYSKDSQPTFFNTWIENNNGYGVFIEGETVPTDLTGIKFISGHAEYGIWNYTEIPITPVIAHNIYWCDPLGPYHETDNTESSGDPVSDYVDWQPFRTKEPVLFTPSTDMDFDGISDIVDSDSTNSDNRAFSDGSTSGVFDPQDQTIFVYDVSDADSGVLIISGLDGGVSKAEITACNEHSNILIDAGEEIVITCGSVIINVIQGSVEVTYTAYDGTKANTEISEGNTVAFEPETFTFEVPEENPGQVVVEIEGTEFELEPGEIEEIVPYTKNKFVLLAVTNLKIKKDTEIMSGDIIVNGIGNYEELDIEKGVTTPAGYEVKANRIQLKKDVVINGDVYYNELDNKGTINGLMETPIDLPVFSFLPEFKTGTAGTEDINVKKNQTLTLDEGNYGEVSVDKKGKLILTGGIYNIHSLDLKDDVEFVFSTASEVRVEESITSKKDVYIGPAIDSEIKASDIIFYVAGEDEDKESVKLGHDNTINANIYTQTGELHIQDGTFATGTFIAPEIILEKEITITRESYFRSQDPVLAKIQFVEVLEDTESKEITPLPESFLLEQNYPNPFNPNTEIGFQIPEDCHVVLEIFNALGNKIATLANSQYQAGYHHLIWNSVNLYGNPVPSGVYLYTLKAGNFTQIKKMILIR